MDDLISSLRVVSLRDAALDLRAMDAKRYVETRDVSLVKTLPGKRAVWYTLRALNLFDMLEIDASPTGMGRLVRSFRSSIEQIEGCEALVPDGSAWRPRHEHENPLGKTVATPSTADLQWLFRKLPHGSDTMQEIGAVALERAAQGNGERGAVNYTAPLLLSDVLAASARLRAAASPTESATPT